MSNPTFWASLRCQVVSWITRISPGFGRFDTFMRRDIYRHNRNKSQYLSYLKRMRIANAAARSLGEIFRIFQICNILLLDEWQYILSLVICSIIQHWWLILIVGGWLIVAMLQYVMAAHTDPSPAATSSAAPSHLILLFLHSNLLVLNMKANVMLFSVSNSIDFEHKNNNNNNNNKQSNKSCQQRAVDRRRFAAAFALPINIKRLWTV